MYKHKASNFGILARPFTFVLRTVLFGLLGLACACLTPFGAARAEKIPSIVVSIAPIKYMVFSITGDRAMVSVVLPNGADPHTYEPSAIQMGIISDADYYFSIQQPFEDVLLPKLADSAPQMKTVDISANVKRLPPHDALEIVPDPAPSPAPANATLVGGVENLHDEAAASEGDAEGGAEAAAPEEDAGHGEAAAAEGHGAEEGAQQSKAEAKAPPHVHVDDRPDPHIWLSPANMKIMAKAVLDQLVVMLPEYADEFAANYEKFIADVDALDASIHALLDPLPQGERAFLSFHPSWAYFARDYNLTQIAVEIEGYEPSPQLFAKIIEEAKMRHVRTIFLEQQFSSSLVRTLAEELNANIVALSSLTIDWHNNLQSLAQILATPPKIPAGFYDDVDALSALRNNATKGSPE